MQQVGRFLSAVDRCLHADAGRREQVSHTGSLTQTESGCEVTDIQAFGPLEDILMAIGCLTKDAGAKSGTPFCVFGRVGIVSPYVDPGSTEFTNLDPRVVIHYGKAPSYTLPLFFPADKIANQAVVLCFVSLVQFSRSRIPCAAR